MAVFSATTLKCSTLSSSSTLTPSLQHVLHRYPTGTLLHCLFERLPFQLHALRSHPSVTMYSPLTAATQCYCVLSTNRSVVFLAVRRILHQAVPVRGEGQDGAVQQGTHVRRQVQAHAQLRQAHVQQEGKGSLYLSDTCNNLYLPGAYNKKVTVLAFYQTRATRRSQVSLFPRYVQQGRRSLYFPDTCNKKVTGVSISPTHATRLSISPTRATRRLQVSLFPRHVQQEGYRRLYFPDTCNKNVTGFLVNHSRGTCRPLI